MLYISGNSWLPCQHWKRASTANLLVRILGFAANSNLAATLNLAASTFHSLFILAFMTVGSTHLSRPSIIRINLWARAWAFDWNLGEEKEHFCSGAANIIVELLCCPLPPAAAANSCELWIRAGPERCVWLTQINLGDVKPWRGVQPPLLFCR